MDAIRDFSKVVSLIGLLSGSTVIGAANDSTSAVAINITRDEIANSKRLRAGPDNNVIIISTTARSRLDSMIWVTQRSALAHSASWSHQLASRLLGRLEKE